MRQSEDKNEINKIRILLWGAGHYLEQVLGEVDEKNVYILAIIDSDKNKQGDIVKGIRILSPDDGLSINFDRILITVKESESIYKQCLSMGVEEGKIISYWGIKDDLLVSRADRIEEIIDENKALRIRLDSAPYEWGVKDTPYIYSANELLKEVIANHLSLARFGDGEFEIILGNNRPWFQNYNKELSRRLLEVLQSDKKEIMIAISQNFVLDQYAEPAADAIREYMYGEKRAQILNLLDDNKVYYDAYVTRPYMIYKDKMKASRIFKLFKEIWNEKKVIIVEGEYSRFGVNNDLLSCTRSVRRIVCPSNNAWENYDSILSQTMKISGTNDLVLISLGPTATVLAYDLAMRGIQAIDIGQLDNEYEWWLQKCDKRIPIPGKMVAECIDDNEDYIIDDEKYKNEIVCRVGI